MALLTVKDLTLAYDKKIVLDGLNFSVNSGDYLCIAGENGTGKSTLMKTILGLNPSGGGEIIFGEDLKRNEIGYLPQQTDLQKDFPASVFEVVLSGRLSAIGGRPFYGKKDKDIAHENIERMGMEEFTNVSYRNLSGGQQQRVLLARALCATEKMLMLDEPVSGLDPGATAEMYAFIEKVNEDGVTVIMISHDLKQATHFASHILKLGENEFFGTKQEYLAQQRRLQMGGDK